MATVSDPKQKWPPNQDTALEIGVKDYPPGVGDFCCYVETDHQTESWQVAKFELERRRESNAIGQINLDLAIEEEIPIKLKRNDGGYKTIVARALITFSERRRRICASLRLLNQEKTCDKSQGGFDNELPKSLSSIRCVLPNKKFLFWADAVADELLIQLGLIANSGDVTHPACLDGEQQDFFIDEHPMGLVVFAGATGTGKTVAATSFVLRYLLRLAMIRNLNQAPPHLVTFEDPIEPWRFFANKAPDPYFLTCPSAAISREQGTVEARCESGQLIAVTAREKGKDVFDLRNACLHALRQKPTLVFVGEIRQEQDWKEVLQLASTGHLVVTTCHASTLIDSFVKMVGDRGKTAEERHAIASALRGVIHLKNEKFVWNASQSVSRTTNGSVTSEKGNELKDIQALFQLWRQSSESVSNFVVDGLSSIFPDGDNVLSRQSLSRKILERQRHLHLTELDQTSLNDEVARVALFSDLNG